MSIVDLLKGCLDIIVSLFVVGLMGCGCLIASLLVGYKATKYGAADSLTRLRRKMRSAAFSLDSLRFEDLRRRELDRRNVLIGAYFVFFEIVLLIPICAFMIMTTEYRMFCGLLPANTVMLIVFGLVAAWFLCQLIISSRESATTAVLLERATEAEDASGTRVLHYQQISNPERIKFSRAEPDILYAGVKPDKTSEDIYLCFEILELMIMVPVLKDQADNIRLFID